MINKVLKQSVLASIRGWPRPVHLIFHATARCNARCGHCFAWRRLNRDKDLTLAEIEKIAKALPGLLFLDLSGGEPFLRGDLAEILKIFEKYSPEAYVNLPTNGLLPEKIAKETEKILQETNLPLSLNLSLDGLEKTHDRIRGVKGCFDKVMATYKQLKKFKARYPKFSLKVVTVISNQNFDEMKALSERVKSKMKAIDFHALTLIRGEPTDKKYVLPPLAKVADQKDLFFPAWQRYGYGKNLGRLGERVANAAHYLLFDLYLKTLREKKMALPCLAGQAHTVIWANGDLALCELLPPLGNLKKAKFDFQKLWWGKKAKKQRLGISQNKCHCTHGCVWTDNLFLNPRAYPALTWELIRNFC